MHYRLPHILHNTTLSHALQTSSHLTQYNPVSCITDFLTSYTIQPCLMHYRLPHILHNTTRSHALQTSSHLTQYNPVSCITDFLTSYTIQPCLMHYRLPHILHNTTLSRALQTSSHLTQYNPVSCITDFLTSYTIQPCLMHYRLPHILHNTTLSHALQTSSHLTQYNPVSLQEPQTPQDPAVLISSCPHLQANACSRPSTASLEECSTHSRVHTRTRRAAGIQDSNAMTTQLHNLNTRQLSIVTSPQLICDAMR